MDALGLGIFATIGVIVLAMHALSVEQRFNRLHAWLHRKDS